MPFENEEDGPRASSTPTPAQVDGANVDGARSDRLRPASRRLLDVAITLLVAAGLWLLIDSLVESYREQFAATLRTSFNRRFANQETLAAALDQFRCRWPPAYPTLLYWAKQGELPLRWVNQACYVLACGGVYCAARLQLGRLPALAPTLLYAVCAYHTTQLVQLTAEALVVPLALAAFVTTSAYLHSTSKRSFALLTTILAILGLVRTFALLWIGAATAVAVVLAAILERRAGRGASARSHLARLALLGSIAVLPAGAWMVHAHERTGFSTGMDRSSWDTRVLPPHLEHWRDRTALGDNVTLTARTLFVDFLSPTREASHEVVDHPLTLDKSEVVSASLGAILLVALAAGGWAERRRQRGAAPGASALVDSPGRLVAVYVATYLVTLIGLWTLSNNDPIYGRFLYPLYPFAILLVALTGMPRARMRPAAWGLFALVLVVHLYKTPTTAGWLEPKLGAPTTNSAPR